MEDIYEDSEKSTEHLNLIQYYALYDPNGEQGLIQGLRYYPRNISTVIPDNPKLDTKINYYKPYTNPKVVLPKPRYTKKISILNQTKANNSNLNTINQQDYINKYSNDKLSSNKINAYPNYYEGREEVNKNNGINEKDEVYRTFTRSYSNDKNDFLIEKN